MLLCVDRSGAYEVSEAEGVQRGTKIVAHLKGDSYDFAKEEIIKGSFPLFSPCPLHIMPFHYANIWRPVYLIPISFRKNCLFLPFPNFKIKRKYLSLVSSKSNVFLCFIIVLHIK